MNRREFFWRAAIVGAGVIAADQLDLLDRLGWTRKFFAGADFGRKLPPRTVFDYDRDSLAPFSLNDPVAQVRDGQYVAYGRVTSLRPLTVTWTR